MAGFAVNIPYMEISSTGDSPIYHRDNNDQGKLEAKKIYKTMKLIFYNR